MDEKQTQSLSRDFKEAAEKEATGERIELIDDRFSDYAFKDTETDYGFERSYRE